MKNTIEQSVTRKESEVAAVAYLMWEKAGHPAGRDLQFWLDAERQLLTTNKAASVTPVAPLAPVASHNESVHKAPSAQPGPNRQNAAKAQRKARRF